MTARVLVIACAALSVAFTVSVLAVPAAHAPPPELCVATAVAVGPGLDMEPVRMERVVDADYYVERLASLRKACKAAGGGDVSPMAVDDGVFVECWSPGDSEFFWSRWVVLRGEVSREPPPAGPADLPRPQARKP